MEPIKSSYIGPEDETQYEIYLRLALSVPARLGLVEAEERQQEIARALSTPEFQRELHGLIARHLGADWDSYWIPAHVRPTEATRRRIAVYEAAREQIHYPAGKWGVDRFSYWPTMRRLVIHQDCEPHEVEYQGVSQEWADCLIHAESEHTFTHYLNMISYNAKAHPKDGCDIGQNDFEKMEALRA